MKLTPTTGLLGFGAKSITGLTYSAVPNIWPLGSAGLNFTKETFNDFKGGICVNTYLSPEEKALLNGTGASNGEWKNKKDKFKSPSGHAKGCAAISWDKRIWDNNRWKGEIRYEWLFTMGPETLVTYGLYNSDEDSSGIKWRTIYVNRGKKENDGLLWEGSGSAMPKKPKFSDAFAPDYDQICKKANAECNGNPEEKNTGEVKWTWEEGNGNYKFSDWSTNFSDAFGPLSNRLLLNGKTSLFDQLVGKKGIWTRR